MAKGVIYIMTTIVPGLIKIGKTGSENYNNRMYNLEHNGYCNVTGLKRVFAIEVEDYDKKEAMLHTIFEKSRVKDTELFALDIDIAKQLLASFEGNVIFPEKKEGVTSQNQKAITENDGPISKRGNFTFSSCGIPIGAEIFFTKDKSKKATVIDDRFVSYEGEKFSLSGLAQKLTDMNRPLQGPLYFEYNGELLTVLRDKREGLIKNKKGGGENDI